jgi:hypothetical protein
MSMIRDIVSTVTGTVTGVAPGGAVSGNAVMMGGVTQKVKDLTALVQVTANTNTITLKARWQVSFDNSTWYTMANDPLNGAAIALATGVTPQVATPNTNTVIPAPAGITGWKFARCQVVVGVVTGTTNDTYSIGYSYRQLSSGEQSF